MVNLGVYGQKESCVDTGMGKVFVFGPVSPQEIEEASIDSSLDRFRPAAKQKKSLVGIASIENGYVYIAVLNALIVGYVTFHPPEKFERWGKADIDCILELGAIEVARGFRELGIARFLLENAFRDDTMEEYIVIATEYYWHWDLEGTGLLVWEYRSKLERIMATVGLFPEQTSDPEINSHPANALMVRIGSKVSPVDIKAFEKVRLL